MRHRIRFGVGCIVLLAGAGLAFVLGAVRNQLFAFDPIRLFYVNVAMPQVTLIEDMLRKVQKVEAVVRCRLREGDARALVANAGVKFTEIEPGYGPQYVQLNVAPPGGQVRAGRAGAHPAEYQQGQHQTLQLPSHHYC